MLYAKCLLKFDYNWAHNSGASFTNSAVMEKPPLISTHHVHSNSIYHQYTHADFGEGRGGGGGGGGYPLLNPYLGVHNQWLYYVLLCVCGDAPTFGGT